MGGWMDGWLEGGTARWLWTGPKTEICVWLFILTPKSPWAQLINSSIHPSIHQIPEQAV